MEFKKIPLTLTLFGLSLFPATTTAKSLETNLSDFGRCIEQGKKIDKYVVSQFNYLNGKYGYVADNSDCYKQNGDVIRKVSNEHFYKRDKSGRFNLIFEPKTSNSRIFVPQTLDGGVSSDIGFDISKYFKTLDNHPPVPPGFYTKIKK